MTDLVVCSLEPWDDVWRRNQFLVRELLACDQARRVLFVEPPVSLAHEVRRRRLPRGTGLREVGGRPGLWALRPLQALPHRAGAVAEHDLCRQVVRAARKLGFRSPTLWVNDSVYAGLGRQAGWPSVYDITDDWLLAAVEPAELRRRERRERRLLEEADAVVVCSPALARSRSGAHGVHLIPNAVDVDHFRRPHPRPRDLPAGPIAVYVGTLHDERVDVDLLDEVAAKVKVDLVLVGPDCLSTGSRRRLVSHDNVHLLGPRPYETVPAYWQHADVVVVPHVVSPFTETLDPIKAYECAAAGRPTLATPVAGFRELAGNVRCVPAAGFAAELAVWLSSPPDLPPPAQPPTWTERARAFEAVLAGVSGRRPPLRVAFVDHCAQLSGAELALWRLLPALPEVEAHVLLAEDGPLVGRLRAAGATVEVLPLTERVRGLSREEVGWRALAPSRIVPSVTYVLRLRRWLRRVDPDLVHTISLKAHLVGGAAAKLAGRPLVWHVHDRVAPEYLPRPAVGVLRAAGRWLPDAIVANSAATLGTLGPPGRVRPVQLRSVIACAVPAAGPLQAHAGLRIGMVGRLAHWKGQHVFLRALAAAFPNDTGEGGGSWEAVIVGAPLFGEDPYETELRRLTAELGLDGQVRFLGFREEVGDELATMDVLVHASVIPEPFGQVVVEGMAAGLPVVAADGGGPAEVIEHGVSGLLYPPGDAGALAEALRALAADPALRASLGRAARQRSGEFTPDVIGGQMAEVYRGVVGGRPRRRGVR